MSGIVSEKLALIIEAAGGEAVVTTLNAISKSSENEAVSFAKATAATAAQTAATDKLAASSAKAAAVQAGGGSVVKGSAEADAAAAAQQRYAISKAESAVASDQLAVAELSQKNATDAAKASAEGATGALSQAIPFVAALGAIDFLKGGLEEFTKLTDEVRKLQQVSGSTAETASLMVGQVKALGVDSTVADKAFFKLGSSLADGTSKLKDYGVATARLKDGTVDVIGTFENARAAYQASTDAAVKDSIAKDIAGKGGAALIPILNETAAAQKSVNDATKAAGGVVNQDQLDKSLALKLATNELKQSFDELKISAAEGVVPSLITVEKGLTDIINLAHQATGLIPDVLKKPIGFSLDVFLNPLKAFQDVKDQVSNQVDILTGATNNNTAAQGANAAASQQTIANLKLEASTAKAAETGFNDLTNAVVADFNAKKATESASKTLADAQYNEKKATEALADLVKQGPVDLAKVASAKDALTTSTDTLRRAVTGEAEAQSNLTKALAGADALEKSLANQKVVDSGDKIASAQANAQKAKEALNALQGTGAASAGDLAAAQATLTTALHGVTDAQLAQQQSQEDLQTTLAKGSAQDPAVISAQKALQSARDGVTSATINQDKAAAALRTAQAGDPAFADKLAAAQRSVAQAHDAVASAQSAQQSSALQLQQATDKLNDSLSTNADQIGKVAAQLKAFPQYSAIIPPASIAAASIDPAALAGARGDTGVIRGARAGGGPVDEGRWLVGERGPEILSLGAGQRGHVTSNDQIGQGVQHIEVNQHNYQGISAAEAASEMAWTLGNLPPAPRG